MNVSDLNEGYWVDVRLLVVGCISISSTRSASSSAKSSAGGSTSTPATYFSLGPHCQGWTRSTLFVVLTATKSVVLCICKRKRVPPYFSLANNIARCHWKRCEDPFRFNPPQFNHIGLHSALHQIFTKCANTGQVYLDVFPCARGARKSLVTNKVVSPFERKKISAASPILTKKVVLTGRITGL